MTFGLQPWHRRLILACGFRHKAELLGFLPPKRVLTPPSTPRPFFFVVVLGANSHQNQTCKRARRRVASHVLIRRNSSRTIIRCSRSHVNHSEASKLFITLCFIYACIFPCHRKVRSSRAWLAGNRAAKASHKDRTAFICRTGREGCAMRGSHSADEPYHLYITSFVWKAEFFFFFFNMQNICPVIAENPGQICM